MWHFALVVPGLARKNLRHVLTSVADQVMTRNSDLVMTHIAICLLHHCEGNMSGRPRILGQHIDIIHMIGKGHRTYACYQQSKLPMLFVISGSASPLLQLFFELDIACLLIQGCQSSAAQLLMQIRQQSLIRY